MLSMPLDDNSQSQSFVNTVNGDNAINGDNIDNAPYSPYSQCQC